MSNTWTSKLQKVSLSKLLRVKYNNVRSDIFVDGHNQAVPLGYNFKDSKLQKAYDIMGVYHDLYMAAACDTYDDYGVRPNMSVLIGSLAFTMVDAMGKEYQHTIPLSLFSSTRLTKGNRVLRASVRGLYAGIALVVVTQDEEQVKRTLLHEAIHAIISTIPELKEQMYGDTPAIQMEEIVTHFVTDHFEKLSTLFNLSFKCQVVQSTSKEGWTASTCECTSITHKGQELIEATQEIKADDPSVLGYLSSKTKEYNL